MNGLWGLMVTGEASARSAFTRFPSIPTWSSIYEHSLTCRSDYVRFRAPNAIIGVYASTFEPPCQYGTLTTSSRARDVSANLPRDRR